MSNNYNFFSKMRIQKYPDSCLLGPEVISSQFGVVNLEQDVGVADGGISDLIENQQQGGEGLNSNISITYCIVVHRLVSIFDMFANRLHQKLTLCREKAASDSSQ